MFDKVEKIFAEMDKLWNDWKNPNLDLVFNFDGAIFWQVFKRIVQPVHIPVHIVLALGYSTKFISFGPGPNPKDYPVLIKSDSKCFHPLFTQQFAHLD